MKNEHRRCPSCRLKEHSDVDCRWCQGTRLVPGPDLVTLVRLVVARAGSKTGQLLANFPRQRLRQTQDGRTVARAYYLWRLARFHGGADVCAPMLASMELAGDPWQPELEKAAQIIAQRLFGTDQAGTSRWAQALGISEPRDVPDGLPSTAYPSGPVHDGNKPPEELLETK